MPTDHAHPASPTAPAHPDLTDATPADEHVASVREADETFTRTTLALAAESAASGGGPFGALVVQGTIVVGQGTNQVTATSDPTAHAEVVALRDAARYLGTHELAGCVLYTSCEPCPMCLGAAWWSRVDRIVFAATRQDAATAGFDDDALYHEVALAHADRRLEITQVLESEACRPFDAWAANTDRIEY